VPIDQLFMVMDRFQVGRSIFIVITASELSPRINSSDF
jgi:hypothetical protein